MQTARGQHYLERTISPVLRAGTAPVLLASGAAIAVIAAADWYVGPTVSLGVLYTLPMMLAATVLGPWETLVAAVLCSFLRAFFDIPSSRLEVVLRFVFALVAYTGAAWIVTALTRLRREQDLRLHAEEQLEVLVQSSPAAILTLDGSGRVIVCNRAADSLFNLPQGESLRGRAIAPYLPFLAEALLCDPGPEGLRCSAESQGKRTDGEIFSAQTWFSSYSTSDGRRLAAIVLDRSEEMRDREEDGLRQLMRGNRIAAAAVCHEIRNLCGAISLLSSNLSRKHCIAGDEDLQGLLSLVRGLENIASAELHGKAQDVLDEVKLQDVLDNLRIVIEPDWRDIAGTVRWQAPRVMPVVLGERHGLMQAFLNLALNSHRAVQAGEQRELRITVSAESRVANVWFEDTGPGIADPERLFEPFQSGADGSGLGLYVSRAVVRSYGGDLCMEPRERGACFRIELQIV